LLEEIRMMQKTSVRESSSIVVNSTAYFILSYLVIYFLQQLITALVALHFEIDSVIHFNYIDFLIRGDDWTFDSVKIVYSVSVVFSMIAALVCIIIYLRTIEFDGLLRLFFLWGFLHSINNVIGGILIGAFIGEGPGYVLAYIYMTDTSKLFLALFGIFFLLGIGSAMVRPMLLTANSYYNSQRPEMRFAFVRRQFLMPFIIGNTILVIAKLPIETFEFLLIAPFFVLLLPLFFLSGSFPEIYFDENPKERTIHWKLIIFTLMILLVVIIALREGLRISV
jgi:hypothetical protein